MKLESFLFEIRNNVGHTTLNQPERGNPFDARFCREFKEIANECDENPEVRAVLIDSNGPYFSVGGDLKTFLGDRDGLPRFIKSATSDLHSGVSRLARGDAPVILACDTLAAGGAVAIVAAADYALLSEKASVYAAFSGIGFSCDSGSSYFMPRRVGQRKAFDFYLRNQKWSAEQCLEYGLASEIIPSEQLAEKALALAEELAQGPTYTYGQIKNLFHSSQENTLEAQLEQEARALADCTRRDDTWNAVNSVAKKQKPVFNYK